MRLILLSLLFGGLPLQPCADSTPTQGQSAARYAKARHFLTVPETPDLIAIDSVCFEADAVRFRRLSDGEWRSALTSEVSIIRRDGRDAALAGWLSGAALGAGITWLFWYAGNDEVTNYETRGYRDVGYILLGLLGVVLGGAIGTTIGNSAGSRTLWSVENPKLSEEIRARYRCPREIDPDSVHGADSLRAADTTTAQIFTAGADRPPDLKREMEATWSRQRLEDSALYREQGRHRLMLSGGYGLNKEEPWGAMRIDYARFLYPHKRSRTFLGLGYGFRPVHRQFYPDHFASVFLGAAQHGTSIRSPTWQIRTEFLYALSDSRPGEFISPIDYGFAIGVQIPLYRRSGLSVEATYQRALESLEGRIGAWVGF